MPWTGRTPIIISIVLWNKISVVENEALEVVVVQGFFEPCVEELSSVEWVRIVLWKNSLTSKTSGSCAVSLVHSSYFMRNCDARIQNLMKLG